jgi:signal transduction histidine kinase/DNA-binding response OmpR family regulator
MRSWFRRWLNDLSFDDPIEQQQAPLLQTLLLCFLIMTLLSAPLTLVRPTTAEQIHGAVGILLYIVVTGAALWVLRRGRFQLAVGIAATGFVLLMADRFIAVGLIDNPVHLLAAAIPIVLAGLLGKRGVLLWVAGLTMVLVSAIGVQPLLPNQPPLGVVERSTLIRAIGGFISITVILVVLVDRFGGSLRRALELTLLREQELEQLRAGLEITVAERTTELRAANADLQRAKRAADSARQVAEEANDLKTKFLANMSHELRTPLNAILNFTDMLSLPRFGSLSERQQDLQKRVLSNADHLLGLINDILDLAKIEAGRMDLFYEAVDLRALLHGVMATAIGLTKDKGLTLTLDAPQELPVLQADKTRVRQVLLNLLSNAAKFTDAGTITLRVRIRSDAMIELAVQDSGIGIAPDDQALIFEEFRQVQEESTRNYSGTGLGLPISRRLVAMHGGQMWLESTPGVGSTFSFTLPLIGPPVERQPPAGAIPLSQPGAQLSQAQALVVVVDDDPDAQAILGLHLGSAGFAVHQVLDSRQACEAIERLQPQLVILDVQMPYLDGWAVLSQLRAAPATAGIPVMICTIVDEQRLSGLMGASDYVTKPVRQDDFLARVRRWVSQPATVLVADDDAEARHILRTMLEDQGFVVREAGNGAEVLEELANARPALLVLDLMMPIMDGFEVLKYLADDGDACDLPVLVVSARDLSPAEAQWIRTRSCEYLQKGMLSAQQFLQQVRQCIGNVGGGSVYIV